MPTRKYKRYKKKTVKRRKNKGGGGNLSRQNPPPMSITPLSTKKTVRFPKENMVTIKDSSPRKVKNDDDYDNNDDDDEDEDKLKKNWNKWNKKLQGKGKKEISFNDYIKKLNRSLKGKDAEEKTEIDTFLANLKNSIPIKNKLAPLTRDEQLAIHMKEEMEKKF